MYMGKARFIQMFMDVAHFILDVADTDDAIKINEAHARK
jgi:hypothetical protein